MRLFDALKEVEDDNDKFIINAAYTYGFRYNKSKNDMFYCDKKTGGYFKRSGILCWDYADLCMNGWEIRVVVNPKYKIGDKFLIKKRKNKGEHVQ